MVTVRDGVFVFFLIFGLRIPLSRFNINDFVFNDCVLVFRIYGFFGILFFS